MFAAMLRSRISLVLAGAMTLQACAVGPNYRPATPDALGVPQDYAAAAPQGALPDISTWWTSFDDPELTSLIDRARRGNLDIAQAVARLKQARESLIQSRASLFPSINASAGGGRSLIDATGPRNSFSIGGDASYQVDLFGGISRSVEAATASEQAAGYDLANVQTTIASEVARNYILARQYAANIGIAEDSLKIQDDNLQIAGWRVQAGLVSSLDLEQARQSRAQTAATVPALRQNYVAAVNRLGVLTGQAPSAVKTEMAAAQPIPLGPAAIPVGLPADILRHRPDVRSAERSLAAATAQVGVQKSALFPALGITGSINTSATAIDDIAKVVTGSLFANLTQLIFDAGRARSRVRAQEAAAEGALAFYKSTVLTGLEDVENALTALRSAEDSAREFTIAADAANNAAILARSQYRAGLTDFTTLNNAESALLSARNGLSNAKSARAQAMVALYLALGGGWDPAAPLGTGPQTGTTDGNQPG